MARKTIRIMEDAYELLKQRKAEGESFSEVIRKLAKPEESPLERFGMWKGSLRPSSKA